MELLSMNNSNKEKEIRKLLGTKKVEEMSDEEIDKEINIYYNCDLTHKEILRTTYGKDIIDRASVLTFEKGWRQGNNKEARKERQFRMEFLGFPKINFPENYGNSSESATEFNERRKNVVSHRLQEIKKQINEI